ncbi:hypothetical protein JCM14036_01520 [Desulfotomaculum defluvii]
MGEFEQFLAFQKELAESTLKIINKYMKNNEQMSSPKRTSKLDIIQDILRNTGRPMHIKEIIEVASRDFEVNLERDSVVSAITKKIRSGQVFVRTGPNTYYLK